MSSGKSFILPSICIGLYGLITLASFCLAWGWFARPSTWVVYAALFLSVTAQLAVYLGVLAFYGVRALSRRCRPAYLALALSCIPLGLLLAFPPKSAFVLGSQLFFHGKHSRGELTEDRMIHLLERCLREVPPGAHFIAYEDLIRGSYTSDDYMVFDDDLLGVLRPDYLLFEATPMGRSITLEWGGSILGRYGGCFDDKLGKHLAYANQIALSDKLLFVWK